MANVTQAPFTTNWTNVAAGIYSITAKATDNLGASTTSAPAPVTVTAYQPKVYDIYTDQIDTPRVITDTNGNEVWRWDSAPFGETLPNEQPTQATSKFRFNFRFPGQYYDSETNLHYNYFRDYDPQAGRYVESDPIGLNGGINTYTYVNGRPFAMRDRFGLAGEISGGYSLGLTLVTGTGQGYTLGFDLNGAIAFSENGAITISVNLTNITDAKGAYAGVGQAIGGGIGDMANNGFDMSTSDWVGASAGWGKSVGVSANIGPGGISASKGAFKKGAGFGGFFGQGKTRTLSWTINGCIPKK
ncbi:hypothetical protein H8L32_07500 [Undibacterium sp. CY18W]|uniref:Teneurin-like YD-shell domain-containing protein n=1 Tax=Undibacterium hunanense TaxID=2762292 RepID=A0ABR6ZN43_9BURK|nr:hypothetical protein [Undibacterium hunanense]